MAKNQSMIFRSRFIKFNWDESGEMERERESEREDFHRIAIFREKSFTLFAINALAWPSETDNNHNTNSWKKKRNGKLIYTPQTVRLRYEWIRREKKKKAFAS